MIWLNKCSLPESDWGRPNVNISDIFQNLCRFLISHRMEIAGQYLLNTKLLCNRTNNNQNCICNTSTAFTEPPAGYLTNYCQYRKGPLLKPFIWEPLPNHHSVTVKSVWHIKTIFVSADTSWERLCIRWGLNSQGFSTTEPKRVFPHTRVHVCACITAIHGRGMVSFSIYISGAHRVENDLNIFTPGSLGTEQTALEEGSRRSLHTQRKAAPAKPGSGRATPPTALAERLPQLHLGSILSL